MFLSGSSCPAFCKKY